MIILMGCDKEVAQIDKSKTSQEKTTTSISEEEKNLAKSEIPNSRKMSSENKAKKSVKQPTKKRKPATSPISERVKAPDFLYLT